MDPASARYIPNKKRELDISGSEVKEDSTFNFARQYFTGDMNAIAEDVMRAKEVSSEAGSPYEADLLRALYGERFAYEEEFVYEESLKCCPTTYLIMEIIHHSLVWTPSNWQ
ncbi:hypothetical protein AB5N19_09852 [Seiridium cardinale]